MNAKTLLIGMFLIAGTASAFAGTNAKTVEAKKLVKTEAVKVSKQGITKTAVMKAACQVTVTYGKTTVTISVSCDCTQKDACDAAYKIATIALQ
jgi:hypothetical protein